MADPGSVPLCPSAQADTPGRRIFGVVEGDAASRRVRYLPCSAALTPDIEAACRPVTPEEVFRLAAPCAGDGCRHFADDRCRLAENLTRALETPAVPLPRCAIRPRCRWWREQGRSACSLCPAIVTRDYAPSDALRDAVRPPPLLSPQP